MFSQEMKIPASRVAVLIGIKGQTKKLIERKRKVKLRISKEGSVIVSAEDSVNIFNTVPMIKAIGRGFNPEVALTLLDESFSFELISIKDFTKTEKDVARIRARIIGKEGKARLMLEKLTETFISIQGKTIGIIGKLESIDIAKRAIEKLLGGAPHGNVYKFIEQQKKQNLM
jgi:ribosomal RNA assembly protein